MIDKRYKNGKIYKLVCNITDLTYFGSTIQTLKERLRGHNKDFRYFIRNREKSYWCQSNKILINNDYTIYLIENYPCHNRYQLNAREEYYIQNYNCINDRAAHNTLEQQKFKKKLYDKKKYELKRSMPMAKKNISI
jgi:hypothetical protein